MSDFRPRIVGGEMEYDFHFKTQNGEVNVLREETKSALRQGLSKNIVYFPDEGLRFQIDSFLENGARYYTDINYLMEYASPECSSFYEAVLYDIAAENYVIDHISSDEFQDATTETRLCKRVSGHSANERTSGAHENYFLEKLDAYSDFREAGIALFGLASHLITRAIYIGAGSTDHKGAFHKTQKLRNLETLVDQTTTKHKPIVNVRNEPLSKVGSRMHVIAGDANISPWATWMKYGTTSLVLRMIENDFYPSRAELNHKDIVPIAHAVGSTASLSTLFRTNQGKKVTALDVQEMLYEQAVKLGNHFHLPSEEYEVISEWGEVLEDLKSDPNKCLDRIDWLQSQRIVEQTGSKTYDRHKRDLGYTMLYPVLGYGARLRQANLFRKSPDQESINAAHTVAPKNTRAHVRGEAVKTLSEGNITGDIGWDSIKVLVPKIGTESYEMPDPYDNNVDNFYSWLAKTF